MTTRSVGAGTQRVDISIEYADEVSAFNPDSFAMAMHALMRERLAPGTVLAPSLPVNPVCQTWKGRIDLNRVWVARISFVIVTRGTNSRALADVVAQAFHDGGAEAVDVADLAQKIDEGDSLPPAWYTGPIGRVSMTIERLSAVPTVLAPRPLEEGTTVLGIEVIQAWQHATVRQGETVVVPTPVPEGTAAPEPSPTPRPYGGTPEEPIIPRDGPTEGVAVPWRWVAGSACVGVLLTIVAVALHNPPPPPPPPPLPARRATRRRGPRG